MPSRVGPLFSGWRPLSVVLLVTAWAILHLGGLFSPGLLDDVDSVYIEAAREMMLRHDYVTPYVDGIRFFDKPPLLYWLAAGSMHVFGVHDWAARLPLALLSLALVLATYALGVRLLAFTSPPHAPDRAALYSALVVGTGVGPYLYTRFYIPDVALVLWMTLAVHLCLGISDRAESRRASPLLASLLGLVLALSVLTKGLVGLVLPGLVIALFLRIARPAIRLRNLGLPWTISALLLGAGPWHIVAALRNPPIPMPPGLGLPASAGWAWFYLVNEHLARFFSRRIPHDYGQVPRLLFWLLAAVWLAPWLAFLPAALAAQLQSLRRSTQEPAGRTALLLLLWLSVVLAFFSLSSRQEYYSLPAVPAMALAIGALLARADTEALQKYVAKSITNWSEGSAAGVASRNAGSKPAPAAAPDRARRATLLSSALVLAPVGTVAAIAAILCVLFIPDAPAGTDIATLLSPSGGSYTLSLDHVFDLTVRAMGAFRLPLCLFAVGMLGVGPGSHALRRAHRTVAANAVLATSAVLLLLSMHAGLLRFYPVLGSKQLAGAIVRDQQQHPRAAGDLILLDGELTTGSSLMFYTGQRVSMLDARINGPWFGSLWPDAPPVFETSASLPALWSGQRRVYLLTYHPQQRLPQLRHFGPATVIASGGGKAVFVNEPRPGS